MGKINWWMLAALVLGAVVALLIGGVLLPGGDYAGGPAEGMARWGSRTGTGSWTLWGPLLGLLMPALWLGIMVLGIIWLARSVLAPMGGGPNWPAGEQTCAACGRPVQPTWRVCPHCGHHLS